jgi:peroxiredoxin Q/BCP
MSKLFLACALALAIAAAAAAQSPAPVALNVGDTAPEFSLPGTDGKTHKLSDYRGKTVVIGWYPAAFTSGCTVECRSFRDAKATIEQYDVAYFMASVDTPEQNLAFSKKEEANFPLLSDPEKKVAAAYGVLGPSGRALRWTFYIGPDGKVQFIDKSVVTATAGQNVAGKLAELNVKKK